MFDRINKRSLGDTKRSMFLLPTATLLDMFLVTDYRELWHSGCRNPITSHFIRNIYHTCTYKIQVLIMDTFIRKKSRSKTHT